MAITGKEVLLSLLTLECALAVCFVRDLIYRIKIYNKYIANLKYI